MRFISIILTWTLLLSGSERLDSKQVLQKIWSAYDPAERFSVYGGPPERAVQENPAELDVRDSEALEAHFCVPRQLLFSIEEGASLVHLMNRCVFSAAVFRILPNQDAEAFGEVLRGSLRNTKWENGKPERYLVMIPEGQHVLIAFGKQRVLDTFLLHANEVYPQGKILYNERLPV